MIEFAERMSKPAVKIVNSYDEFMRDILVDNKEEDKDCPSCILPPGSTGVAFWHLTSTPKRYIILIY